MSNAVLRAYQLSKTYKEADLEVDVLKDIDFTVEMGEMIAIVGASGVGKSTLLHLLGALDNPTNGYVEVMGENITTQNETQKSYLRNHYLGFVYQFHHLLPEFNALENIAMPLLIRGLKPQQAQKAAEEYIAKVELSARAKHRIGELSGGERQRIAIARALVTEPKCILADEPTGNLDHKTATHIYELMRTLNQELNISFVVVTHNEQLAGKMDRIMVLANRGLHDDTVDL